MSGLILTICFKIRSIWRKELKEKDFFFCIHFMDKVQGNVVSVQQNHIHVLRERYLRFLSWFLGVIVDTMIKFTRCNKSSIKSKIEGSSRKKRSKKKNRYISKNTSSASILDAKSTFSVELCKRKHCVCVQRASLRKSIGHCLHSK